MPFGFVRSVLAGFTSSRHSRPKHLRPVVEELENRELLTSNLALDLGPMPGPVKPGFTPFAKQTFDEVKGYGWENSSSITLVDRHTSALPMSDFVEGKKLRFAANLPNGSYRITLFLGDPKSGRDNVYIKAEGTSVAVTRRTKPGDNVHRAFTVDVTDGKLNLDLSAHTGKVALGGLKIDSLISPVSATFTNNGAVNEGSTATVTFAPASGLVTDYRYSFDFNNDGNYEVIDTTSPSATVPAAVLRDNGAYTVRGRISKDGASAVYSTTINVSNVAPTVSLANRSASTGVPMTLFANVSDSPVDTTANFTYLWNFGDGTTSTQASPTHIFGTPATYPISVTVTDKDGASATANSQIVVSTPAPVGAVIDTGYDRIPNFGVNPNIVSITNGNWSDANTWSLGRIPQGGDIVSIANNTFVTFDVSSNDIINTVAIQAGGHLYFRTDISTRLTVVNLLVLADGELQVGTAANPVAANVKAEVIIANVPLDTINDPSQYGNGLIALGQVSMHGAVKNDTFVRLAAEPLAGATTLMLETPVTGWRAGDRLILPDTRQLTSAERGVNYVPQWEMLTLAGISDDGKVLTLSQPLQFNHRGARNPDGVLEFLPHVGNLTRNVVIRSQSATGTRGYTMFTERADVDIRYVAFQGLGRTTNDVFDNTAFDAAGNITHIGTNEAGRYPVLFNHLIGPTNVPANGYQFTFEGNAVFCPLDPMPFRWGIDINDSHYGLIKNNVIYNWAGAGLVTESGAESHNLIEDNFVIRINGTGNRQDHGRDGAGFWFHGPNNYVRGNVATNVSGTWEYSYGFTLDFTSTGYQRVPSYPGADTSTPGQYTTVNMNATPVLEFANNEAYGVRNGMTYWWLNAAGNNALSGGESILKDFRVWGFYSLGVFGYHSNGLTLDHFIIRGNPTLLSAGAPIGITLNDYFSKDLVINDADIQGMQTGVYLSTRSGGGSQTVQNSYLRNLIDISMETMWTSAYRSDELQDRRVILRDNQFDALDGRTHTAISMAYATNGVRNLISSDEVLVYNYNHASGDNFRVYYNEQAIDFVLPQTVYQSDGAPKLLGSPEAGLTNEQNWNLYGIALAGELAPSTATTRAGIRGLVSPLT